MDRPDDRPRDVLPQQLSYGNDYMRILKADNREGFKRMVLLTLRLVVFYAVALWLPANRYANRLLAVLTLYIWLSQGYVRTSLRYNVHSLTKKKMQFVCNFGMNHATSVVFLMNPLMAVLLPELSWLPGFVTLLPIFCRFTQCYIVGTHEQFLNSIKFTLNLVGFGYSVVGMPALSHYWRIAAAVYSFYWDIVALELCSSGTGSGKSVLLRKKITELISPQESWCWDSSTTCSGGPSGLSSPWGRRSGG
jgi:hypothetical protein